VPPLKFLSASIDLGRSPRTVAQGPITGIFQGGLGTRGGRGWCASVRSSWVFDPPLGPPDPVRYTSGLHDRPLLRGLSLRSRRAIAASTNQGSSAVLAPLRPKGAAVPPMKLPKATSRVLPVAVPVLGESQGISGTLGAYVEGRFGGDAGSGKRKAASAGLLIGVGSVRRSAR
jgi:hypothetical protein